MRKCMLIGLIGFYHIVTAQDSTLDKSKLELSGYFKDLVWLHVQNGSSGIRATQLLHNRMNLKWTPSAKAYVKFEWRNRVFYGSDAQQLQGRSGLLRNNGESINLSTVWYSRGNFIFHSNVERLYIHYQHAKGNLRIGRQRINWGMANTWNPNDLFNTYNFLDFDFEERPGSDAVKAQFLVNDLSNVEFAVAATNKHPIVAVKYATNVNEYDIQGILGYYQQALTAGIGWAGHLSSVGFKGESQFYFDRSTTFSRVNISVEADYMFKNGWYASTAVLYNQRGRNYPLLLGEQVNFYGSPRNLMPFRWNMLVNLSKSFTPLFNGTLHFIVVPGAKLVILNPSLGYSVSDNLSASIFLQSFFSTSSGISALSHTIFFRLKLNF